MSTVTDQTIQVHVYEDDPLLMFVERAGELSCHYELPVALVEAYEAAHQARGEAVAAIEAYIRDNNLPEIDWMENQ